MLEDIRPAPPSVQAAVREALVVAGCPTDVADRLAGETTVEREGGEGFVCLLGLCVAEDDDAVEQLVRHAVEENAEAHDRTARGEAGCAPFWHLPSRRPRRG